MSFEEEVSSLAGQVMRLAHDDILMHLRFFDAALAQLDMREKRDVDGFATDGQYGFYDPLHVLRCYREEQNAVARACLHMLLHCVFSHSFQYERLDREKWNLAADLAVEEVILELGFESASLGQDVFLREKLDALKAGAGQLTAERLYRYLQSGTLSPEEEEELRRLSFRDDHSLWQPAERLELTQEQWKKISRRVKTDLQAFAAAGPETESLKKNLEESVREKYDYAEILRRFAAPAEELSVSEDEFDYIYYTYGLNRYGNLPLIEPLEYRERKKAREFVVGIDTSASCRGPAVRAFLRKTYALLKAGETFSCRTNIHIVQCDHQVQSDTKITCEEDLEDFLRRGKLTGFGATDFRPVFEYVEKLREQREFENLKGLIYFTDGYGIYPEKMPDYQVIFAFLGEDGARPPVPVWSMKAVLDAEGLEQSNLYASPGQRQAVPDAESPEAETISADFAKNS